MSIMDSFCGKCNKKCFGEVLFAHGEYYHQDCFKCKACMKNLLTSGFYNYENEFYCTSDYQDMFGVKCRSCGAFIEGEAVTILEDSYHQECFSCARCRTLFPPGGKINFDGNDYYCEVCIEELENELNSKPAETSNCAGCGNAIKSGQALLALDSQWHLWCFTCHKCGCLLSGEYMGRDGVPYCEKDYQNEFGVSCAGCGGYITGKVLQAGEKHYHPQCSRCAKCDQMFGEGEEMYLQGSEIWHPRCSDEYQRDLEENARIAEEEARVAEENARNARNAEEKARNAYHSVVHDKPEPQRKPQPVSPKSVSPQPSDNRNEAIINATTDYLQKTQQEPTRNEKPYQPKPWESYKEPAKEQKISPKPDEKPSKGLSSSTPAYSARPFGSQKAAPGSISINFKPKSTVGTTNRWKPPEQKTTNEPERPATTYKPSTFPPVPAKETIKKPEPERTAVLTENTTKYDVKVGKRSTSPPSGKDDVTPPVNGYQKTSSVSSDEGAPARPPPPPTRGSSQNWKSRISTSTYSTNRPTSPPSSQETSKAADQTTVSSGIDVRSANRPLSYIDSAAKRDDTNEAEAKTRTTTNITIKSVTTSDDAPLPNALYRRIPARDRELARENRKSMPSMPDSADGQQVVMRENGPARTEAKVMNRRSLPSMDRYAEEQARKSYPVYPYTVLKTSNYKMPKEIDRSCLEAYLAEEEFEEIFRMDKNTFYKQPAWKQRDLKKKASLF